MGRDLNAVGYPYISFKVKGFGLSVNFEDKRPDYFSSLNHQRYVDKANVATIQLVFVPKNGTDPNLLESAISDSGRCEYSYGYAGYTSKVYRGLIHSYNVDFREGALSYTLKIVSEAVTHNYDKIKDASLDIRAKGKTGGVWYTPLTDEQIKEQAHTFADTYVYGNSSRSIDAKSRVYSIKENQLKLQQESTKLAASSDNGGEVVDSEVLETMERIVKKYCKDSYTFDKANSVKDFKTKGTAIVVQGESPIKALQKIASELLDSSGNTSISYKIVISDDASKGSLGTITLKKFAETTGPTYQFDWNGRNTDIISWNPQYDGSVAIFTSNVNGKKKSDILSSMSVDVDGKGDTSVTANVYTIPSETKKQLSEGSWSESWDKVQSFNNAASSVADFEQRANYPYKGTLEVLGVSDREITLVDSRVTIVPLVNGKPHHTAGIYTVVGITDKISSQGFTTVLEVVKYADLSGKSISGE